MNGFTAFKYMNSQREEDISRVIEKLRGGEYDSLVQACDAVGLDPRTLTQKEINFIKRKVG